MQVLVESHTAPVDISLYISSQVQEVKPRELDSTVTGAECNKVHNLVISLMNLLMRHFPYHCRSNATLLLLVLFLVYVVEQIAAVYLSTLECDASHIYSLCTYATCMSCMYEYWYKPLLWHATCGVQYVVNEQ